MWEYQKKNIFAKGYTPNWSEENFLIKEVKNTVPWTSTINDLSSEEIIRTFYQRELQKTSQQEFKKQKVIKRKKTNYMPNGKEAIIHLIAGLIKET